MAILKIFVGTVYGGALDVAEQLKPLFEEIGYEVYIHEQASLEDLADPLPALALFCTSTTGSGEYPGDIAGLAGAIEEQAPDLGQLRYGLIALGDSSYETFCGAGRALDALLEKQGARRLGERLEVDAMDTFMADDEAIPWAERWIEEQHLDER